MWVADMDFRTPDFIIDAIRERTGHEILGYTIRSDALYRAIINWYDERQKWRIEKDWILFTPGVVAALSMAVRTYTSPGDKIIIQPPVYHPFFSVIRDDRRKILYNRLIEDKGYYRMDLEDLKRKIDPSVKLLLLSHPHNPVGRSWKGEELRRLADLCLENNIIIVSDEIHSDMVYRPHAHIPLFNLGDDVAMNTVACVAASKTFNLAGLSTSVVIIKNEKLRSAFNREISAGHLHMGNIFGSIAMETAYTRGQEWLAELMEYLRGNLGFLKEYIDRELPDIKMYPAEATYLAWLDMKGLGLKGKDLRKFIIHEAGLGFNDGTSFGPGGEGYQRLNFACPRSVLAGALDQLKEAIHRGF
jgi:cystathionine beta-lyase